MGILRELIARFDTGVNTEPLEKADGLLDQIKGKAPGLVTSFEKVAKAIAGIWVVSKAISFAREFADEARKVQNLANRLQITTDQVQALGEIAHAAGINMEQLAPALGLLSTKIGEAATHTGQGADQFAHYKIKARDAHGAVRGLYDILGDVADRLQKAKSRAEQYTIANALLGEQGRLLVDVLSRGSPALRQAEADLRNLGGGLSQASIAAGVDFGLSMHRANLVIDAMRSSIATALLPIMSWMVNKFVVVSAYIARTTYVLNIVKAAMLAFAAKAVIAGAEIAAAFGPEILAFVGTAAGIVLLTLLVDDLIGLFSGSQSIIGEWVDEIWGVGTAAEGVEYFKGLMADVVYLIHQALDAWREWTEGPLATPTVRNPLTGQVMADPGAQPGTTHTDAHGNQITNVRAIREAARQRRMNPDENQGRDPRDIDEHAPGMPRAPRPRPDIHATWGEEMFAPHRQAQSTVPVRVPGGGQRFVHVRESQVSVQTPVTVHITNPVDPAQTRRAARAGVEQALETAQARQVRELESSGLISRVDTGPRDARDIDEGGT